MTGQITGTPQVLQTLRWYTIWANNSGGSDTVTLGIEVIDIPPEVTYASTSLQATLGTPIAPVTAISIGGDVVTWSVQPPLPAGMVLDEATGTITGTPNMPHEARTHVISATNSGGTVTVLMTVEVVDVPPSVSVPSSINLTVNHPVPELAINLTGGASTTYSIQPALPLGLYLHPPMARSQARRRVRCPRLDSCSLRRIPVAPPRAGSSWPFGRSRVARTPWRRTSTHLLAKMTARASAWTRMGTGPSTRMR